MPSLPTDLRKTLENVIIAALPARFARIV